MPEPQPQPEPKPEPEPVETPEETPAAGYMPVAIPGRVEAETVADNYDTTPGNVHDAECGESDLDLELSSDVGGGCHTRGLL